MKSKCLLSTGLLLIMLLTGCSSAPTAGTSFTPSADVSFTPPIPTWVPWMDDPWQGDPRIRVDQILTHEEFEEIIGCDQTGATILTKSNSSISVVLQLESAPLGSTTLGLQYTCRPLAQTNGYPLPLPNDPEANRNEITEVTVAGQTASFRTAVFVGSTGNELTEYTLALIRNDVIFEIITKKYDFPNFKANLIPLMERIIENYEATMAAKLEEQEQ